jgi:hypothetical protein
MKAHSEEVKAKVLKLLQEDYSQSDVCKLTGVSVGSLDDWTPEWRKKGLIAGYKKPGMEFFAKGKSISNGYYGSIRKRYNSMQWTDKCNNRFFGFNKVTEAIHYYLDTSGNPRLCTYCGSKPPEGKVWGMDRIDSSIGHKPGNLVPCCYIHNGNRQLSCQVSKSKFSLREWLQISMSRTFGRQVREDELDDRILVIMDVANQLEAINIMMSRGEIHV